MFLFNMPHQIIDRMSPYLGAEFYNDRLGCFFSGLLRGEAGPIIKFFLEIAPRMRQVAFGLGDPIFAPFH